MEKTQKNNLFSQIVQRDYKDWENYSNSTYLKDVRCLSYHIHNMLYNTLPIYKKEKGYLEIKQEVDKCKLALFTLNNYFEKYEKANNLPKVNLYEDFFKQN